MNLLDKYSVSQPCLHTFTTSLAECGGTVAMGKDSIFGRDAPIITLPLGGNLGNTRAFLNTLFEWYIDDRPVWLRNGTLLTVGAGAFEVRVVSPSSSETNETNESRAISFFVGNVYAKQCSKCVNRSERIQSMIDFLYILAAHPVHTPEDAVKLLGADMVGEMLSRLKDWEENGRPWKDPEYYREFLTFRQVFHDI
jgi:hypothetical protein